MPECNGRCTFQVKPDSVDRVVTPSTGFQTTLPKVVHPSCRPVFHSSEPQAPAVCISSPGPTYLGHRCPEYKLVGSHGLCIPAHGSPSQGGPKDQSMQLPHHTDSPRLARDVLILGPSAALNGAPTLTPSIQNTTQTISQSGISQQPPISEPARLVSKSGQLKEQGFSVDMAERIAAPQRSLTRSVYKSKWAFFEKWCRETLVDFSNPSIKQVSDFFMYLYQDLNRCPSTIDGYRMAIVQRALLSLKARTLTG